MSQRNVTMQAARHIDMLVVECDGCGITATQRSWGSCIRPGEYLIPDRADYSKESPELWLHVPKDDIGSSDDFCVKCKENIFAAATKKTV